MSWCQKISNMLLWLLLSEKHHWDSMGYHVPSNPREVQPPKDESLKCMAGNSIPRCLNTRFPRLAGTAVTSLFMTFTNRLSRKCWFITYVCGYPALLCETSYESDLCEVTKRITHLCAVPIHRGLQLVPNIRTPRESDTTTMKNCQKNDRKSMSPCDSDSSWSLFTQNSYLPLATWFYKDLKWSGF